MSSNFDWNDADLNAGGGEFIKLEKVGDGVSGHITGIGKKVWDDGSVSPQLDITTDDGEQKTYTAGQIQAKSKLMEQRPVVGDHIAILLSGIEKRSGGKTLKLIDVTVTRGGKKATAKATAGAPVADDSEPPF